MWKDICGYEGYYQVSDDGTVRSVDRKVIRRDGVIQMRKARIISQARNTDGYPFVKLCKDGKSKTVSVHRLVAMAFVDGYFDGAEVNHKDCNRQNNNYKNLEWVTHNENIKYTKSLLRHVSDRDLSGSNNPNYGNHKLHDKFESMPELRMKQSRPGKSNGRARKTTVYLPNGLSMTFDYIRECSKYLIDNGYVCTSCVDYLSATLSRCSITNKEYRGITVVIE